jgi:hypothetical protein
MTRGLLHPLQQEQSGKQEDEARANAETLTARRRGDDADREGGGEGGDLAGK